MAKAKAKVSPTNTVVPTLEGIKKLAVTAMFADDELFEHLVLKGGNAMDLIHRLSSRASVDLDFSMQDDFPEGVADFGSRIERALVGTFRQSGLEVFDVKIENRPSEVTADMAAFWGGYGIEFKLISSAQYKEFSGDISELRKHALSLGQGKKFLIDISRFEFTYPKQEVDLDGYRIHVYSPEMIVCEKLRAICQQMEAYGPTVKRARAGSPRAKDFIDIYVLVSTLGLNIASADNFHILQEMFKVKRVPLEFLLDVESQRDFHRTSFPAVQATLRPGATFHDFDFYFDFVLSIVNGLKASGNI